jgi:hypothetical protein
MIQHFLNKILADRREFEAQLAQERGQLKKRELAIESELWQLKSIASRPQPTPIQITIVKKSRCNVF